MKNQTKNIAAAIIIIALFFVPVFCSAQVSGGGDNIDPSTTIINPPVNDNSVEEEEAEEEYQTALAEAQLNIIFDEQNNLQNMVATMSSIQAARHAIAMMIIRNLK